MFSVDGNCSLIFQSCAWTRIINRCNRYKCRGAGETLGVHRHSWMSSRNVSTFLTPSAYVLHLIWDYFCLTLGWFHWSKGKNWRMKIAPLKSAFCKKWQKAITGDYCFSAVIDFGAIKTSSVLHLNEHIMLNVMSPHLMLTAVICVYHYPLHEGSDPHGCWGATMPAEDSRGGESPAPLRTGPKYNCLL